MLARITFLKKASMSNLSRGSKDCVSINEKSLLLVKTWIKYFVNEKIDTEISFLNKKWKMYRSNKNNFASGLN